MALDQALDELKVAKATLADVPLVGGAGWTLASGTAPHVRVFEFARAHLDRVFSRTTRNREVKLELRPDGAGPIVVEALSVIGLAPANHPDLAAVYVADRRWRWNRVHVRRAYNARRRTGSHRFLEGQRVEVTGAPATFDYAEWSLKDQKVAWGPLDVLRDVLGAVAGKEFVLQDVHFKGLNVEGLELDDAGDAAVGRTLGLFPGADLYVDRRGKVVVYNRLSGNDADLVAQAGPPIVGSQLTVEADHRVSRPSKVIVLFTREQELRLDYDEVGTLGGTIGPQDRALVNVLPMPDPQATIAGKRVGMGTWVAVQDALDWFNASANPARKPYRIETIRKLWAGVGNVLESFYATGHGYPDAIQARRVAAIRQHYRQTFRLTPFWRTRLRSLRAARVSLLDVTTGQRAPAGVWQDYAIRPGIRALMKETGDRRAGFVWNVLAQTQWPTGEDVSEAARVDATWSKTVPLKDGREAPAHVTVLDEDAGVFRVDLVPDYQGLVDAFIPSAIDPDTRIPRADPKDPAGHTLDFATLFKGFSASVVLTVVAGAPNDDGQFFRVEVEPREVADLLGADLGPCEGPPWTIRVGAGLESARFGWSDSHVDLIERSFGAHEARGRRGFLPSGPPGRERSIFEGAESFKLDDLLVNQASVRAVARAAAARVYALLPDVTEGTRATRLLDVEPDGSLANVRHELLPSGALLTYLDLPQLRTPPDVFSLLPESVRRVILRQVAP